MFCRVLCVSVHSKLCHLAGGELRYGPKPDRIPLLAYTQRWYSHGWLAVYIPSPLSRLPYTKGLCGGDMVEVVIRVCWIKTRAGIERHH